MREYKSRNIRQEKGSRLSLSNKDLIATVLICQTKVQICTLVPKYCQNCLLVLFVCKLCLRLSNLSQSCRCPYLIQDSLGLYILVKTKDTKSFPGCLQNNWQGFYIQDRGSFVCWLSKMLPQAESLSSRLLWRKNQLFRLKISFGKVSGQRQCIRQ